MTAHLSLLKLFSDASLIVQAVMITLIVLSIFSWATIFQQLKQLKQRRREVEAFKKTFWSGVDLGNLYSRISNDTDIAPMEGIFVAGFKEFMRMQQEQLDNPKIVMEGIHRAMQIHLAKILHVMGQRLPFLATVQSMSPYIGLFGTVWGIMHSFHSLGAVQQATLAMVAPGISEALIATAMGLIAAIPAGIAYNRFAVQIEQLTEEYDIFLEEFTSILYRRIHAAMPTLEQVE